METYLITSISDENTRFFLVKHESGWSAEKRVLHEGQWVLFWATAIMPVAEDARDSIRSEYGV